MTEVLAIIPARGGSKGIPRKNIRDFAGHPLVAWSIAAGRQSKMVTRVIVSTDDQGIASVAREYGAEVPFLRPAELAQDHTLDLPVFEHALKWLEEIEGYRPEIVVQLRPTSPVRPRGCVDDAVGILLQHPRADCVRGVVPAGQNPHKMWRISRPGGPMRPLLEVPGIAEPYNAPRQILPPVYWQTGHVDAIRISTIARKRSLTGDKIYPLVIDARYTVDIDNLSDWAKYEAMVYSGALDMVSPRQRHRPMPGKIKMIITDFDGVITDGRVWTDENGKETVAASRSDSMRVGQLRERGVEVMILSSEVNPVVQARADKMGVAAIHGLGLDEKGEALRKFLAQKQLDPAQIIYLGNDFNDLPCFALAGWAVAVADAYPEVIRAADYVVSKPGGSGALRELCDLVLNALKEDRNGS
ncbi:MAG TPA: acylneuraminate cytidylyltransferase [Anaerolineales bacterium]|nr:acylneuraminate cytidylyltransferase [Anaerolineales bacterium]